MAGFDGSGNFSRTYNWVTDKGNSVKITASRMDTEDDGFATGLSTAICKDGQTTTTAVVPFAVGIRVNDGSATIPSVSFTGDTNSGWYRIGADNIGLTLGGSKIIDYSATGITITGTASVSGAVHIGGAATVGSTLAVTGALSAPSLTLSSTPLAAASGGTGDSGTAWSTYTATAAAVSGSMTTVATTAVQKSIGKTQFVSIAIAITNKGTGSGACNVDLPATANSSGALIGYNSTPVPLMGTITGGSKVCSVYLYDGTTAITNNGFTLVVGGSYEKQ